MGTGPARGGRVLLVCGLPGAGKTTLARRLEVERGGVLLCPDDWLVALGLDPLDARPRRRFERELWRHALRLAGRGLVVVVELGGWTRPDRRRLREEAHRAGVPIELHALDVPFEERWRRVERRNAEPGAVVVGRDELAGFERWWQPPDDDERAAFDPAPGGGAGG
ncbi:ATP-binding protein [Nocardioides marinquilinus]|uniref:AAA family ATPase n=1 Tax=Nocardioides marinquilinus TaxID=1210400 RepID=UPI0031E5D29D